MKSKLNKRIKGHVIPVFIMVVLMLIGYYQLFSGGNFYTYKDPEMISAYTYGNSLGNGWRPDKGFGISFFFGDPSNWHPWSPFVLWEKIAPPKEFAYDSSIVILNIMAAISLYFSMLYMIPRLGNIPASLLAILVVFCSGQAPLSSNRIWISALAATPPVLILLYSYYKRPRTLHFFLAILLFFFTIFFGNIWAFTDLLSVSFVFSIIYWFYFKESVKTFLAKFLLFYSVSAMGVLLLGFWAFYSMFLDYNAAGGYMREKVIEFSLGAGLMPDIKSAAMYLASLLQIEWLPINLRMIGLWPHDFLQSLNITAIFPVVFIFFLFRRSANFWEHVFKTILAVFYVFWALNLIPVVGHAYSYISVSSKSIITMYGLENIAPLQVFLIGVFICEIKDRKSRIRYLWGRITQRLAAALLFFLYGGMAVFCLFALLSPDMLPNAAAELIGRSAIGRAGGSLKDVVFYIASNNIYLAQKAMHWYSLVFFSLTAFLVALFFKDSWLKACAKRSPALMAGILAASGILLSWTIYPLNKNVPVWEKIAYAMPRLEPTDRFYFVDDVEGYSKLDYSERLAAHKKRAERAGGLQKHLEYKVGFYEPPALSLSGNKSFTQKNVGEFLYRIFNKDGTKRIEHLRDLTTNGPMLSSDLLDMGAVSYYYSGRRLINPPKNLSLCTETDQMYIYKNKSAWPYYYLAEKTEMQKNERLKDVRRGTAYLTREDFFALPEGTGGSSIRLKEFSYGRMIFDYRGDRENFLVVADAWHPFWKARAGGSVLPVIKTNEIFKGIRLPKGEYMLDLFFDTAPFFTGIYVSAIAWILFLAGLVFAARSRERILTGHLIKTDRRYE